MYIHTAGQRAYVAMTKKTYHVQNPTMNVWPTMRFHFHYTRHRGLDSKVQKVRAANILLFSNYIED